MINLQSIPGIHLSLTLEQVRLVFTTKFSFLKKSMLISNQKLKKKFKGAVLTIFLACIPFGAEGRYKHIEWCSQNYQDHLNDAGASLHVSQPASQPRQRACIQS
jgi:hypothetical protein